MADALHLVKVPFRPERLAAIARRRGLPMHHLDEGYLAHCVLRELWQAQAPAPFVLRGRGRTLDIWGYAPADATELIEHAQAYGDPTLTGALEDVAAIVSKPMPQLAPGRRVGFLLRACPVVRLGRGNARFRAGAELDAFLARCLSSESTEAVSREAVYREWLVERLQREATGVAACTVRIGGYARDRLVRRTHAATRKAQTLDRPDVRFEGELTIADGARFNRWLAHGVGRHRAFGFGALLLVPPGTTHAA